MKFLKLNNFISLIFYVVLVMLPGFSFAADKINGGPAQLPQQNILQPAPENVNPNLKSNVQSGLEIEPVQVQGQADQEKVESSGPTAQEKGSKSMGIWVLLLLVAVFAFVYYIFNKSTEKQ